MMCENQTTVQGLLRHILEKKVLINPECTELAKKVCPGAVARSRTLGHTFLANSVSFGKIPTPNPKFEGHRLRPQVHSSTELGKMTQLKMVVGKMRGSFPHTKEC